MCTTEDVLHARHWTRRKLGGEGIRESEGERKIARRNLRGIGRESEERE